MPGAGGSDAAEAASYPTAIRRVSVPTEGGHAGQLAVEWSTREPFQELTLALGAPHLRILCIRHHRRVPRVTRWCSLRRLRIDGAEQEAELDEQDPPQGAERVHRRRLLPRTRRARPACLREIAAPTVSSIEMMLRTRAGQSCEETRAAGAALHRHVQELLQRERPAGCGTLRRVDRGRRLLLHAVPAARRR